MLLCSQWLQPIWNKFSDTKIICYLATFGDFLNVKLEFWIFSKEILALPPSKLGWKHCAHLSREHHRQIGQLFWALPPEYKVVLC